MFLNIAPPIAIPAANPKWPKNDTNDIAAAKLIILIFVIQQLNISLPKMYNCINVNKITLKCVYLLCTSYASEIVRLTQWALHWPERQHIH